MIWIPICELLKYADDTKVLDSWTNGIGMDKLQSDNDSEMVWEMEEMEFNIKPYPGKDGGKITRSAVFAENRPVSNGMRQLILWHCNRPLGLSEATECIITSTSGFTWPVCI